VVVVGWWGPLVVVGWWWSAGGGRLAVVHWWWSAGGAWLVRSAGGAWLVGGFRILAAFAARRAGFARVRAGWRGSHGARRFAACSARARFARGRCV
jgi:hypothetical protein